MLSSDSIHAKGLKVDRRLRLMLKKYPGEQFTQSEIAEFCGLSRARVSQIEKDALKKLYGRTKLWKVWKEMGVCLHENRLQTLSEYQLRQLQDGIGRVGYQALGLDDSCGINPVMLSDY